MAESLKERQARLAERLKTEPSKAPIQEVNPVTGPEPKQAAKAASADADELVQLNSKVPKTLRKALQRIAFNEDREMRDVVQEALEAYVKERQSIIIG